MKKILFASTALVATAGIAAAEISFSGEAGIGMTYEDGRTDDLGVAMDDWQLHHYATLSVSMTGETDGGLSFGADFDITTGAAGGGVGASSAYIEGGFGKFSAGDVDNAVQAVTGLSDIGYSGLGTDNVAEGIRGLSQANTLYQGTFGDFTVAASYELGGYSGANNDMAIGAKYSMGDYSIALGYGTYDAASVSGVDAVFADSQNALSVQVGASFGDFSLNALYSTTSLDGAAVIDGVAVADTDGFKGSQFGITAGYTMGATTITAAYSESTVSGAGALNGTSDAYGIGVSYDLGGGASVDAGVGEVGGVTVADLGIIMTF